MTSVSLFPMFLKLEGRTCLVVGAGSVGEPKIRSLLQAGADVRVAAPCDGCGKAGGRRLGFLRGIGETLSAEDLDGVFLVIAATNSREVNEEIFREAQWRKILCNAVDDPEHCDFYYPAVVRRGQLQLAISTGGKSPALAQRLRRQLETQFSRGIRRLGRPAGKCTTEIADRSSGFGSKEAPTARAGEPASVRGGAAASPGEIS